MVYEYGCENCGAEFEVEHGLAEKGPERCEKCGAESVKRLIAGGTSFILKGPGWASDGYALKGQDK